MPRPQTRKDGSLRESVVQDFLNEKKLRVLIRRLRDRNVELMMSERNELADTLERVLAAPAKKRWEAAIGSTKRGRPSKFESVAKHERWERCRKIAQTIANYRDGKGPDKTPHSLAGNASDDGAFQVVVNAMPGPLREEVVDQLKEKYGEDVTIQDADISNQALSVVRNIWEMCRDVVE